VDHPAAPHSLYYINRPPTLNDGEVNSWIDQPKVSTCSCAGSGNAVAGRANPGLLRWDAARWRASYHVVAHRCRRNAAQPPGSGKENVHTNRLDEREFHTFFHQSRPVDEPNPLRVRGSAAVTDLPGPSNGLPRDDYGRVSPIYSWTNPPVKGGADHARPRDHPTHIGWVSTLSRAPADSRLTWHGNQNVLPRAATRKLSPCLSSSLTRTALTASTRALVVGSPALAHHGCLGGTAALLQSDSGGIAAGAGAYLETVPSRRRRCMRAANLLVVHRSRSSRRPSTTAGGGARPPGPFAGIPCFPSASSALSPRPRHAGPPPARAAPVSAALRSTSGTTTLVAERPAYYLTGRPASPRVPAAASVVDPSPPGRSSECSTCFPVANVSPSTSHRSLFGVAPNSDTATIGANRQRASSRLSSCRSTTVHGAGEPYREQPRRAESSSRHGESAGRPVSFNPKRRHRLRHQRESRRADRRHRSRS